MESVSEHWVRLPFESICRDCNQKFYAPNLLLVHMPCFQWSSQYLTSNTGDVAFGCHLCDKSFANIDLLRNHIRFKLEKLYQCNICKKRFTTRQHVERHVASHSVQHRADQPEEAMDCVVESVQFFSEEGDQEARNSSDEQDRMSEPDDKSRDPDFAVPGLKDGSSSSSHTPAIAAAPFTPTAHTLSPADQRMFGVKRGRGRPRKYARIPVEQHRAPYALPASLPFAGSCGAQSVIKRGPGRPRKNDRIYHLTPTRKPLPTARPPYEPPFEPPVAPPVVSSAVTSCPAAATRSAVAATQSAMQLLSSIKHCATCNGMFFQQKDYDRHISIHAAEKVSVECQTDAIRDPVVPDGETVNNLPGSNSEHQDSSESFSDALSVVTFQDMLPDFSSLP